jgi:hypothetical protein
MYAPRQQSRCHGVTRKSEWIGRVAQSIHRVRIDKIVASFG